MLAICPNVLITSHVHSLYSIPLARILILNELLPRPSPQSTGSKLFPSKIQNNCDYQNIENLLFPASFEAGAMITARRMQNTDQEDKVSKKR